MIEGINHITFSVKNVKVSIRFYRDVLGLRLIAKWSTGAYFTAGPTWIALFKDQNISKRAHNEYSHIAFTVPKAHFHKMCERIRLSKAVIWQENKSEGNSLYFRDPNGHKFEIHASNLRKRVEYMRKNPWDKIVFYE